MQGTGYVADDYGLSFLLSFNLKQKMKITEKKKTISNNPKCGPAFGSGRGNDFCVQKKCN